MENHSEFDPGSPLVRVVRWQPFFFNNGSLILAHEDFRSLVTREDPVRPGEVVHAYAVGLGPVTPDVATGVPTPLDQLYRLADPFDCRLGSLVAWTPLEVTFAGLAPGMIGIYQVSVRMPESLPPLYLFLHCGFPENDFARHGGGVPGWPR